MCMREEENRILEESFFCEVLPCGLKLYVLPKRGFGQKSGLLSVDFGSIDRHLNGSEIPAGVAHFLEHRMFEKPEGDISERFSLLGAEVEAETTFTSTSYSFVCTSHFEENLSLLLELVFRPFFTEEGVARERQIIDREIRLYGDDLEWIGFFNAMDAVFPGHPLAVDIAGTPQSICQIDREILDLCYRMFYHPANMGLFICGDVDLPAIRALVDSHLSEEVCSGVAGSIKRVRQVPQDRQPGVRSARLSVAQPHLSLVFKDGKAGLEGEELLRRELALELALDIIFGPSSTFYNSRYEEGVIDVGSFGYEVYAEPSFGLCLIGGEVQSPEQFEKAVVEELYQARECDPIERDFARVMRKAYGNLLQGFDQVESCVQLMCDAVGCGADPFGYFAALEKVTVADVKECLESCLDYARYGISRIDPLSVSGK